jgi:hypothetical protein
MHTVNHFRHTALGVLVVFGICRVTVTSESEKIFHGIFPHLLGIAFHFSQSEVFTSLRKEKKSVPFYFIYF